MNQDTLVNKSYTESPEYRRKLNELGEDVQVTREISKNIQDILTHRSGTEFEDLAYVNSISGKSKINKSFDEIRTCKPSKQMTNLLKQSSDESIIGIHNHPNSRPPSIEDIYAAKDRGYKYGIVACHDGTVYKYTVGEAFNDVNVRINIDKLGKISYNQGIKSEEFLEVIRILDENGVTIEVL